MPDRDQHNWHVRRIVGDDITDHPAGEKKILALRKEKRCKCEIWFPKREGKNGKFEILFPGYALLGIPKGLRGRPCALPSDRECILPLRVLTVDVERQPLSEESIKWILKLERSDSAPKLRKGQRVIITTGDYRQLEGRYQRMASSTKKLAIVEIPIFQRLLEISISPLALIPL